MGQIAQNSNILLLVYLALDLSFSRVHILRTLFDIQAGEGSCLGDA